MEIQTQRLLLRDYQESDFERVHLYASLPDFSQYDVWGPNSEDETRFFLKDCIEKSQVDHRFEFEFAIVLKESNLLIGGCGIRRDWPRGSVANLGYAVNPDFQKRGYATEATKRLIQFGFEDLGLAVIYATCDTRNTPSFQVMENSNMKRVGEIKEHKKVRGVLRDSFCYEVLHPRFS